MHICLSELGLNASWKLLIGRESCLLYCAYLHQKLEHSLKQKAETHTDGIQGKQHQDQEWRISWQITVSNGWVREQQPAHKHCMNSCFPWWTSHPKFMPSSKFYPIPFVFPHIPAARSCLPTLPVGALVSVTHVCVVVAPGITDPSRGWAGAGPGFFGLTVHGWVKAVWLVFVAEDRGSSAWTLVSKTPFLTTNSATYLSR